MLHFFFLIFRWIQSCSIHMWLCIRLKLKASFCQWNVLQHFSSYLNLAVGIFFFIFVLQTSICCEHLTFKCLIFQLALLNVTVPIGYMEFCFPLIAGVRIRIRGRSNLGSKSVLSGSSSRAVIHLKEHEASQF